MENEIWKDVVGYEGLYQVSNLGRVKGLERTIQGWGKSGYRPTKIKGKIMKASHDRGGYLLVGLSKDGKVKTEKVHRLVLKAFLEQPEGKNQVNHKNEIRDDNRLDNLEWCDSKYNVNYGERVERSYKPIVQMDMNNKIIKIHASVRHAYEYLGKSMNGHISSVCNGKRNDIYGYKWVFESEL